MASKLGVKRVGQAAPPSTSSDSAQAPMSLRHLSPQSKTSTSALHLCPGFKIHFAAFSAGQLPQAHFDVALARAKVIYENNVDSSIEDSLLLYSQISRDKFFLWVFCIEQSSLQTDTSDPVNRLLDLKIDGLTRKAYDKFSYADLYPCSAACSTQRYPCPSCLLSAPDAPRNQNCPHVKLGPFLPSNISCHCQNSNTSSSHRPTACHLPRHPLRQPLALFLNAVQERVINDICESIRVASVPARRFGPGILYVPADPSGRWGDGWEQQWKTRPLTYCHINIDLHATGILIQPRFQPTHFLPFLPSLPLPSGTPINLLPFGTPAYFLNMYKGSTSGLAKLFQANLVGLGAGALSPGPGPEENVRFVIAWINVQNKQGEEKGIIIIWPAPLCVSLMSMPEKQDDSDDKPVKMVFAYNRKALTYIPELPLALQPSPVPAPATVPIAAHQRSGSPHENLASPSLFTPIGRPSSSREATPTTAFPRFANHPINKSVLDKFLDRPPLIHAMSSFSSNTTHAFRALTMTSLPPSGMRNVAESVGKFVDFMAKERERERERIRREKEREASAAASTPAANPGVGAPSPTQGESKGFPLGIGTPQSPGVIPSSTTSGITGVLQAGTANTQIVVTGSGPGQRLPAIVSNTQAPQGFAAQTPVHAQAQQSALLPNHPSYPSPPEELGKADHVQNNVPKAPTASSTQQTQQPHYGPATNAPFDSFDSSNMDKFMMDLGMDFNMTLPPSSAHQGETIKVDFDSLGEFTDDDFNFFDDPVDPTSASVTAGVTTAPVVSRSLQGSDEDPFKALGIPSFGQDNLSVTSGSAMTSTSIEKSSPLDATKQADRNDTRKVGERLAPDLLPGSPEGSSISSAGPATPEVINVSDVPSVDETNSFDPISFSKHLHSVDAKYAIGKFSSALIEKDPSIRETDIAALWRTSYDSLTDPRIEVVKKLIGIKRKLIEQGIRAGLPCPPFQYRDRDQDPRSEWESCISAEDDQDASVMDVDSERESDTDDQIMDEWEGGGDSVSRPSTPLASHLPLGPTLIPTQFEHFLLLPLSVNLKPPGAAFASTLDMASPLPNPVPTPVSPAAVAGSTTEKTKSLEAAVRALAVEVVENASWEAAWRVSSATRAPLWKQHDFPEIDDGSAFLSSGLSWETMNIYSYASFASSSEVLDAEKCTTELKALDQPMFTVGKADLLVQISPPALRFWSKLGLTPRSGPKDVTVFVLYEVLGTTLIEVEAWFKRVSSLYSVKGYGKHSLGKSTLCSKDGFVPVRLPNIRKALTSLVDSYGSATSPLLIYMVIPCSILSLSSPILPQVVSSVNRILSSRDEDAIPICFHSVSNHMLSFKDDVDSAPQFEAFVDNVYNRIPRPVDRFMSRPILASNDKRRKYFEAPSFTLARPSPPPTSLSFQYPPPDLSSVDQHTLLHVGYAVTKCKRWLTAACIDQRGEGHDLAVWFVGDESDYKHRVSLVWNFARNFARKANVEWRIALAKLGGIGEAELEAWNTLLNDELSDTNQVRPMHFSLLCVDHQSGWSVLPECPSTLPPQKPPPTSDLQGSTKISSYSALQHPGQGQGQGSTHGQTFSSANSMYIMPSLCVPLPRSADAELGTQQFIPEDDESSLHPSSSDRLRPLSTSALLTVPLSSSTSPQAVFVHLLSATTFPGSTLSKTPEDISHDICQNYHELTVLTQARWHLNSMGRQPLPYHLAALRTIDSTLELSDMVLE